MLENQLYLVKTKNETTETTGKQEKQQQRKTQRVTYNVHVQLSGLLVGNF